MHAFICGIEYKNIDIFVTEFMSSNVNYHRWDVCKAAVLLGKKENLPVYKFLKEPLIRKFGEEWYKEMEIAAEELERRGLI